MILDRLILRNIGLYAGSNEFILTPNGPEQPIILIGGMNGAGKTTLLDSIQLAFYGSEAGCAARGQAAYKEYLSDLIHRSVDREEGAAIEVHFRRMIDGAEENLRVTRSWRQERRGMVELLDVEKNGEPDVLLAEHWHEYIESYLPANLANLFFFDGEQIKELAEGEGASRILSTAIHALLGLDLVDQLAIDLQTLERRKRLATLKSAARQSAETRFREAERLRQAAEQAAQIIGELRNRRDRIAKSLEEAKKRFRDGGGDLFLRRGELEAEHTTLREALAVVEKELREIAAGPTPLLLLLPHLEAVEEQARTEIDFQRKSVVFDAETTRDVKILQELRATEISADALNLFADTLMRNRTVPSQTNVPCYLAPPDQFPAQIAHLRGVVLPALRNQIKQRLTQATHLQEKLSRLEQQLMAAPDSDMLARLQRDMVAKEGELRGSDAELGAAGEKHRLLHNEAEQLEARYRHALEAMVEEETVAEDDQRILEYSPKVRATLETFRIKIVQKQSATIERLMLDSFRQLLRKDSLVSEIRIDPERFRLDLTGGDGKPLPIGRLSAGERQLLATSLLWGLARASGRPVPTMIDTPLGRLDSSHRHHLVERYFPFAAHQVILLSTDEEISPPYLAKLAPFISRTYHLNYDHALRRTFVEASYFPHYEAAS